MTNGANQQCHTQCLGLLSQAGGQKSAAKKIPHTDALFTRLHQVHHAADSAPNAWRMSLDAKATVTVGPLSRGGKSRAQVAAADHDCKPEATLTPVGSLVPTYDAVLLYGVCSKVTSACLADCITQWWDSVREPFAHLSTLVSNRDNGPENHSRRTQFMQRMVDCAHYAHLHVRLAYYPPYHSKDNPIERCWGIWEHHWHGALLDSIETVLASARTMTWTGIAPGVELVTTTYKTGVKLTQQAMNELEKQLHRQLGLEKWVVDIYPTPNDGDT